MKTRSKSKDEAVPKKKAKAKPEKAPAKKRSDREEDPYAELAFSLTKSDAGRIKTSIQKFGGKLYLDIRHYYKSKDGEWLPTKKGITIPVELTDKFSRRLRKMVKDATEEGLETS